MKKLIRIWVGMAFAVLVIGVSPVAADVFNITYYDNYNNDPGGSWEAWQEAAGQQYWNPEYLANFGSGNTFQTAHYLATMPTFDLRGGYVSLDGHAAGDEDWNPLLSVGDNVSGQDAHHVFAAEITGLVHFNVGDVLSLQSDDDAYIFLDGNTNWGQEILSHPGIHYFGNVLMGITAAEAGTHLMTVRFAERMNIHSGIQINLNGEPLPAVPVPGAVLLGMLGLSVAGVKLRRFA